MLKPIGTHDLKENVFSLIADRWLLITAGTTERLNTMTAAWGGLGVFWRRDVATMYIRPTRYTYEFANDSDYFSMAFFPSEYKKQLAFCGTKSGRDVDKVKECGFTVAASKDGVPYFEEADLVIVCKKIYYDDLKLENFLDPTVNDVVYPDRDYHRMYVGEIVEVLQKG